MSQQKPRNPDVDWGFHATIPRVIRTNYKSLTSVQKWLYVCLKDLCGETGTCYRTLRVLAEETGISTGMLSESIAALHKEGLIHAEKKRRSIGGKEVWHITIVDIWQSNAKAHPTKRSPSEQTSENVHSVNNNVHHVNDDTSECSHSEPECSHSETEEVSSEAISFNEAVSLEEREVVAVAPTAPAELPSQENDLEETQKRKTTLPQNHNMGTQPPLPRKPRSNAVPPRPAQQGLMDTKPEISPEAAAIMDLWDEANTKKIPRTARIIQGATLLVSCNPTAEKLKTCKGWLFTTDNPKKPWYRKIGVDLLDVANNWSKWESLGDTPQAKPPGDKEPSNEHKAAKQPANAFIERCLDKDYNKRKLEEMRAENERRRQAAGGVQ